MSDEACVDFLFYGCFFFFNDTATTEIYTLSLHDALPISVDVDQVLPDLLGQRPLVEERHLVEPAALPGDRVPRSEEHTSELQSRQYLVCRLLLEKKKIKDIQRRDQNYNAVDVRTSYCWHI